MEPLAIIAYKKLMPGSQLLNRLQDLRYRVRVVTELQHLVSTATSEGPMFILLDLDFEDEDVCAVIRKLRESQSTRHIPVVAFAVEGLEEQMAAARAAGATLVAGTRGIQNHLPELLEQALGAE